MKNRRTVLMLLSLLIVLALGLSACGGAATPETVEPTAEVVVAEPTEAVVPTEEPAAEPTEEMAEEPTAEPTEVGVQPLIQGSGAALQATDALTSHAVCVTWDGTEYYNDYGSASVTDAASAAVHQALFNALVGQQVGSRVLVTLPGSVAYPTGNRTPSIAPRRSGSGIVETRRSYAFSRRPSETIHSPPLRRIFRTGKFFSTALTLPSIARTSASMPPARG